MHGELVEDHDVANGDVGGGAKHGRGERWVMWVVCLPDRETERFRW